MYKPFTAYVHPCIQKSQYIVYAHIAVYGYISNMCIHTFQTYSMYRHYRQQDAWEAMRVGQEWLLTGNKLG